MKQTVFFSSIFIGLLIWTFHEHFEHNQAFNDQNIIQTTIIGTNCGKRSNIQVSYANSTEYVRLKRWLCADLQDGQIIELIISESGTLYWNEKPTKRVFWFIPMYVLIAGYIFIWHQRKRKKRMHKE